MLKDLTGLRFNRLVILKLHEIKDTGVTKRTRRSYWQCRCDCGTVFITRGDVLKDGQTKSCGCFNNDRIRTHGLSRLPNGKKRPEFKAWQMLIQRCINPKAASYSIYGGRGIRVCARWRKFENFYADMGPRPSPEHSIDRRNNNGDYKPSNCRWATRQEQANNRRNTKLLEYNGDVRPLAVWARCYHLSPSTVWVRIRRGWPVAKALGVQN